MRAKVMLLLLCLWAVSSMACQEPQAWQNSRRYAKTDSKVFISNAEASQKIAAAWRPSAVCAVSADTVYFADRGTRQVKRFDVQTKTVEVLAELAEYESLLSVERAFDQTWGEDLQKLGLRKLLLLAPARAMAVIDTMTGQVSVLGSFEGLSASEGLRLDEIDFSNFAGFGQDQDYLYLVFGAALFRLKRTGQGGVDFNDSRLEHIAGSKISAKSLPFQKAKEASLHLDAWTRFVSDKGLLYFWEPPHFRAIKDGMLISLGGNGFQSPNDVDMKDFNARHLPNNPALAMNNGKFYSPYWRYGQNLIEMQISDISSVDGSAQGWVRELALSSSPASHFSAIDGVIISVTEAAGNLWRTSLDTLESQLLFGPSSEQARFDDIAQGEGNYDLQSVVAAQSMLSMLGGKLLLAYAPSIGRLSGFSSKPAEYLQTLWTAKQGLVLQHLISNGENWAWFSAQNALYAMHIDAQFNLQFSYQPYFFIGPHPSGSPARASVIKFTESPQISPERSGFYFYMPQSEQLLVWTQSTDEVLILAEASYTWAKLSKAGKALSCQGLILTDIQAFASYEGRQIYVQNDGTDILIGLCNLDDTDEVYGAKLEKDKVVLVTGQGERPLEAGMPPSQLRLESFSAIAFDPQNLDILMAADKALWQISEEGLLSRLGQGCGRLPDEAPQAFVRLYAGENEVLAILGRDGQAYACSQTTVYLGTTKLSQAWTPIASALLDIDACDAQNATLALLNERQVCALSLGAKAKQAICTDAENGWRFKQLSCRGEKTLVSAEKKQSTSDTGFLFDPGFAAYEIALGQKKRAQYLMGVGLGLLDEGPISQMSIGYQLEKMASDGIPAIYFWMRDTCSIWRLVPDPQNGIEKDSLVSRHITHPKLCSASSMAVRFDSSIAIVDDNKLWQWTGKDFKWLADIPSKTLDMIGMGQAFIILTRDGIYSYERGALSKNVPNPISIDGLWIDYAVESKVFPKMLQVIGENAVYLPVFDKNRILKLAL